MFACTTCQEPHRFEIAAALCCDLISNDLDDDEEPAMHEIGQIGLIHTTGLAARIIQAVTGSYWNHVTIRVSATTAISAQPGGVVERPISDYPETVWSRFPYSTAQVTKITTYARDKLGAPYNWIDDFAIGLTLKLGWHAPRWLVHEVSDRHTFQCSQLADAALIYAGVHVFDDGRPSGAVYPASFVPLFHNLGWMTGEDPW